VTRGPLDLLGHVASILDGLAIPYALGGSLASSLFGEPRSTADVDIAVRLNADRSNDLLASFDTEFYVPTEAAHEAVTAHSSFNVLDTTSGLKVDLFVLGDGALDTMQIERRIEVAITGIDRPIWVTSPEVQVLRKLDWFVREGGTSDRQWRDVISILRITTDLDRTFLAEAARTLGLDTMLADALGQAG